MAESTSPASVAGAASGVLRLLVADDLTGAADAGVKFVARGYASTVVLDVDAPFDTPATSTASVTVVNADTRRHTLVDAQARLRRAGRFSSDSPEAVVFKKIDSTLRGHVGSEIAIALEVFHRSHAIVAPSFPAMGRIVRDGWLLVGEDGVDGRAEVRALLANQGLTGCVSMTSSRAPTPNDDAMHMAEAMSAARRAGADVLVFDAESDADLATIVTATVQAGDRPLWVGSAGLAGALASHLATRDRLVPTATAFAPARGRVLLAIGSTHAKTAAQLARVVADRGVTMLGDDVGPDDVRGVLDAAAHLLLPVTPGGQACAVLRDILTRASSTGVAGLILSGGDTAADACAALGAKAIRLGGEVAQGMPWGTLVGGCRPGLPVVLKSGALGEPRSLVDAVDFLSGNFLSAGFLSAGLC